MPPNRRGWIWKGFFLSLSLGGLFFLGFRLWHFLVEARKDTLLELGQEEQVLVKYRLDKTLPASALTNSLQGAAFLEKATSQQKGQQEKLRYQQLEDYYDLVAEEYAVEDNFRREAPARLLSQDQADASGRRSPELNFKAEKQPLDAESSRVLSSLRSLKVLSRFDGSAADGSKAEQEQQEKVALQFDSEYAAEFEKEQSALQEQTSLAMQRTTYQRPLKQLAVYGKNKFYTSPKPLAEGKNHALSALRQLKLVMEKERYFRFEVVRVNLVARGEINLNDLKIYVKRGSYLVPNVGGRHDVFFKYKRNTIYANLAMGYNPSPGRYTVLVRSAAYPDWPGLTANFLLLKRKVPALKKGFSVVNLEYTANLKGLKIRGPHMRVGGYEQLMKWVKFMGADAFWMLAAQTTGWDKNASPKSPWLAGGARNLRLLAPLAQREGILLGAYVMSYFTPMNGKKQAGYSPSLGYSSPTGRLEDSLHISLMDEKRLQDIADMVKSFQQNPRVAFVGLDFIRTGRADGYEMAERVIDDMNIATPKGFERYSQLQKIKWFASRVERMRNVNMVTKWRWWRAHRVATIVNEVIRRAGATKPLWVFTLGWEHGKQHGQDPYMFFDAGAFIDAVMLYEANRIQFRNMMVQWPNYMRDNRNNVVIGNATDVRFLDSVMGNIALEYIARTQAGYRKIYRSGFAKGIFMHDLSRALWSSKRGIDISEWAMVHGYATAAYRYEQGLIPYRATVQFQDQRNALRGSITVENTSKYVLSRLALRVVPSPAWSLIEDNAPSTFRLRPGEKRVFEFRAKLHQGYEARENLLGYYVQAGSYPRYFFFDIYSKRNLRKYVTSVNALKTRR